MKILVIDNYDSFTYNLVQYIGEIANNSDILVKRNDKITIQEIEAINPSHIVLSPGPGYPKDAGILEDIVRNFACKIPMLGVCLGHQAICEVAGGKITSASHIVHGKPAALTLTDAGHKSRLFAGINPATSVARYHSLALNPDTIPSEITVLAFATEEDGSSEIMAVQYGDNCFGVQFHPESILTPEGKSILRNFLAKVN